MTVLIPLPLFTPHFIKHKVKLSCIKEEWKGAVAVSLLSARSLKLHVLSIFIISHLSIKYTKCKLMPKANVSYQIFEKHTLAYQTKWPAIIKIKIIVIMLIQQLQLLLLIKW